MTAAATLAKDLARRVAPIALANIVQEYPNKLDHLMGSDRDVRSPRELHPAFYGSYDWHSSVHMHWTLVRCLRYLTDAEQDAPLACLGRHFSQSALADECAYLDRRESASFERPYGWAWLLALDTAIAVSGHDQAASWQAAMEPLASRMRRRFADYLPRARYPVRGGTHGNSAFALILALDHARQHGHDELESVIVGTALRWFSDDIDYPDGYEPSGDDFLSGGLCEAVLMQSVLPGPAFRAWWHDFMGPRFEASAWRSPALVTDRSDAKHVHLDGLNLSRAWCLSRLAGALGDAEQGLAHAAYAAHLDASLFTAAEGDYVGTHWLASFAWLAIADLPGPARS